MTILPREQVIQRHPRSMVSAHGVVIWEAQTDLATSDVAVLNDSEAMDLIAASIDYLTGGSSGVDRSGLERDNAFSHGFFDEGTFGGDDE